MCYQGRGLGMGVDGRGGKGYCVRKNRRVIYNSQCGIYNI